MSLYKKIEEQEEKISLIGLGYVGMPIAVAFANKAKVIGYDLNSEKIKLYQAGIDPTNEVGNDVIANTGKCRSYPRSFSGRRRQQNIGKKSDKGFDSSI